MLHTAALARLNPLRALPSRCAPVQEIPLLGDVPQAPRKPPLHSTPNSPDMCLHSIDIAFALHLCRLVPSSGVQPANTAQAPLCTAKQPVQPWACDPVMHPMHSSSLQHRLHCPVDKFFSYGLASR